MRGTSYRLPVAGLAFGLAVLLLLLTAAPSPAPVPPRNCGMMTVEGDRYQVKADQVRCKTAKSWTRRYIADGRRPKGYSCKHYDASTALEFRCRKSQRVFFAIRR